MTGMTYNAAVGELAKLRGRTVLVQVRPTGAHNNLFSMLDGINEVSEDDADPDRVWMNFHDAEAGLSFTRSDFVDAGWEPGWRKGEEQERLFRVGLGVIEVGFLQT